MFCARFILLCTLHTSPIDHKDANELHPVRLNTVM